MFLAKKSHKITKNIRKRKKNENKLCKYRIFFVPLQWEVIAQLKNYAYEWAKSYLISRAGDISLFVR